MKIGAWSGLLKREFFLTCCKVMTYGDCQHWIVRLCIRGARGCRRLQAVNWREMESFLQRIEVGDGGLAEGVEVVAAFE